MAVAPEHVEVPIVASGGARIGEIDSFVTVSDGAKRWLELTGTVEDEARGHVEFTARIPIAEGWTLVRLHGH
jgi:hypothetical protein